MEMAVIDDDGQCEEEDRREDYEHCPHFKENGFVCCYCGEEPE